MGIASVIQLGGGGSEITGLGMGVHTVWIHGQTSFLSFFTGRRTHSMELERM